MFPKSCINNKHRDRKYSKDTISGKATHCRLYVIRLVIIIQMNENIVFLFGKSARKDSFISGLNEVITERRGGALK